MEKDRVIALVQEKELFRREGEKNYVDGRNKLIA
jgi:hypothetical protein